MTQQPDKKLPCICGGTLAPTPHHRRFYCLKCGLNWTAERAGIFSNDVDPEAYLEIARQPAAHPPKRGDRRGGRCTPRAP